MSIRKSSTFTAVKALSDEVGHPSSEVKLTGIKFKFRTFVYAFIIGTQTILDGFLHRTVIVTRVNGPHRIKGVDKDLHRVYCLYQKLEHKGQVIAQLYIDGS